jgi:tetratricopeptide (TPR) repeat protein
MSFAVLPFTAVEGSVSPGWVNEWLSDELPQLLAEEAAAGWVLSKAQMSASDRSGSLAQIGKRLNVEFLVQGTTHLDGEVIFIQASLIEVSSGRTLRVEKIQMPRGSTAKTAVDLIEPLAVSLVEDATKAEASRLASIEKSTWDARDWLIASEAPDGLPNRQSAQDVLRMKVQELALAPEEPHVLEDVGAYYAWLLAANFSDDPVGDHQRAQDLLRKALNLNADEPHAWLGMGVLFQSEGDWGNAVLAEQRALRVLPNNFTTKMSLAFSLAQLGRSKEAIDISSNISATQHHYFAYYTLGFSYLCLKNFQEAEKYYHLASLDILPNGLNETNISGARIILGLASAQAQSGHIAEAKRTLALVANVPAAKSISAMVEAYGKRLPLMTETLSEGLRKAGMPER